MIRRLLMGCSVLIALAGCAAVPSAPTAPDEVFPCAAVAADHAVASAAGVAMLEQGGNAVDATVAASFCLSVVRPYSCGIGGGGFMIIHLPADEIHEEPRQVALCYRERSPAAVDREYYVGRDETASRFGPHAVGVPGTVAGLLYALETYGTLDRDTVLAPAIHAARNGYRADAYHVAAARVVRERLDDHPELRRRAEYLWQHLCHRGELEVGDLVRDPEQARALDRIRRHGRRGFYRGLIADAIVAAMEPGGGPLTAHDLGDYVVEVSEPLRGEFGGREVLVMPPPSSGGVAELQILGMLAHRGIRGDSPGDPRYVHLLTEALKHAFADRARWLADAAFAPVPIDALLAPRYLAERAGSIADDRTHPPEHYGTTRASTLEDGGTSHISVIDGNGGAVACTETINLRFGSLISVPGFGFTLNNEMDDFTTRPGEANAFGLTQSGWNLPAPGKRPLSSMSPTIVLRDGEVELVAGGSGGPRIITGTLQCILNAIHFGDGAAAAVNRPRFHHQWMPDRLQFEERWEDRDVVAEMDAIGHRTDVRKDVGHVQVLKRVENGISAASDPRKGGRPAGY